MAKWNGFVQKESAVVVFLILNAVVVRILGRFGYMGSSGLIRGILYIGLYSAWAVSLYRRIIQTQVRRYLISAAVLMVFWFVARTIKYDFVYSPPSLLRGLWYSYYVGILFIPLLTLLVAMSTGKPENNRLPSWATFLFVPSITMLVFVLTNDYHQLIFVFPPESTVWTDKDYGYAFGYWCIFSWSVLCTFAALIVLMRKCRVQHSRKMRFLPLFPFAAAVLYVLLYDLGVPWINVIGGDMTAVLCLFFASVLESCIQSGLVQSNSDYETLFLSSGICAQIIDTDNRVYTASGSALELPAEVLQQTTEGAASLDRNILLKSHPIRGGRVVWYENIKVLIDAKDKLADNRKKLEQIAAAERESYDAKRRTAQLREKNRLYNLLQQETEKQNELLGNILEAYSRAVEQQERHKLLAQAAVIGAYIKRRGNLIFMKEKAESISVRELSLCINESMQNLELLGAQCKLSMELDGQLPVQCVTGIFDVFEKAVEAALQDLQGIWVHISQRGELVVSRMEIVTCADLKTLFERDVVVSDGSDGTWSITYMLPKGCVQV